ncbi:MAG TPA: hypothetical protein VK841_20080 [Polyangiaceae bacterium]|jgi:hypothetical protein|nr:hypothetical protein [Polyangiaceae bacterium]
MKFRVAAWLVALGALLVGVTESRAYAQTSGTTTTTSTTGQESITASQNVNPDRIVNGQDLGESTRPQNLNPTGINYSDCISDMSLQFSVTLSGFAATDNASMQIWATDHGDCTASTSRGIEGINQCWPLGQGTPADFVATSSVTQTFTVRVQDIVGPQNESPTPNSYTRFGPEACAAQPTSAAVSFTIWFLALDSSGNNLGTAYQYPLTVDLVGPPPPVGISHSVGDTLFNINWSPNIDSDTAGYDVYIDPIPGGGTPDAEAGPLTEYYCPDAYTQEVTVEDDAGDGGDATTTITETVQPACSNRPIPTVTPGGMCTSNVLTSGIVVDGGEVTTFDEAGLETTTSASGGISTIPSANLVGINAGFTIASESAGTYTIVGLTNGVTYNVAVSAVDGSGNIGPISSVVCDYPAPVNDFWTNYRNDGGLAGGGFCALEAVGLPVGPTVAFGAVATGLIGVLRRRRRRR